MITKNFVSIIIANWNGGEVFKNCLKSLRKMNFENWELIVVDNGSIDGSEKFINRYVPEKKYKLIKNSRNLGFAQANNQGSKIARGKFILLLNNDTIVSKDFLDLLIQRIDKEDRVGVIQPKILVLDKPKLLDSVGSFLTVTGFLQHLGYMEKDNKKFNNENYIFSSKGACMLIRKKIIDKIGLFDNDFGSYFEETDFCWRVWIKGYKILYYPKSVIYHKIGYSSKKQDQSYIFYHSSKNRICTLLKNLEIQNVIMIGGFHLVLNILLGIYYLTRLKLSRSFMIWKALLWNLINLPKTLDKRRFIQQIRIKRDREIIKNIMVRTDLSSMITHFTRVEANFK